MTERFAATAPVVNVDGAENGALARDVLYLRVDESTEGMKTLELHLSAQGPRPNENVEGELWLDGSVLDFGKTMEISIGAADSAHVIFSGAISAIEATHRAGALPTAIVYAEDKLMQLRLTRRMRTYRDVTDGDIAEAIAREHGLQASADAPGPRYDVVQQWNQSDLAFLRERARLIQAEVWVADETLHFATRGNRTATTLSLVAGDELLEVQLRADLAHQRTGVHVSGYDAQQRAAVDESSGADAIQAEIAGGRTGPAILEQAFGARVSYRVRSDPFVADEARAWAKGEMLRRSRAFVSVTGTTNGSADMMVGSTLSLDRVGTPFNGDGYYVTRVSHTYDLTEGFRTHFDAERATVNA